RVSSPCIGRSRPRRANVGGRLTPEEVMHLADHDRTPHHGGAHPRDRPPPGHSSTWLITIEPSPTAEPTRLTDPRRTSPTAKMPGTQVSSISGGRGSGQRPLTESAATSRPVITEPHLSRCISGRRPVGGGPGP